MTRPHRSTFATTAIATIAPSVASARAFYNFPNPVTPTAIETLHVHDIFLEIVVTLFTVSVALLFYSLIAHRRSRHPKPAIFTGPRGPVQWIFVTLPFIGLAFIDYVILGIPAYKSVIAQADTKTGAQLVVKVVASQWQWKYEYPSLGLSYWSRLSTPVAQIDNREPKNRHFLLQVDHPMVVPVNEKVRILLTSNDVLHSWWVPAFGVKQDVVPGFLRETWINVDKPGVYRGQCAELCGVGHAFMPIVVDAKTPQDFKAWVAAETAAEKAANPTPASTPGQGKISPVTNHS